MIPRIDAHHHFWQPARGDYGWLRADDPAVAPLYRDYLPEHFKPQLAAHGVVQTVLVQAAQSEAETDFLLALAAAQPKVGAVVGWVDLSSTASIATLERWAQQPKFKSVRPMLQALPQADWIAHAPHPEVMRTLLRLGLRFDALVKPWHLSALLTFVRAWPDLPVVIDHGAKPQLARGWQADWVQPWREGIAALAALPQVSCKFSGLLTETSVAQRASVAAAFATVQPVWETLLTAFGATRLMWGSDWPVLTLADDYAGWIDLAEALSRSLSDAEAQALWHDSAARFYGLVR